MLVGGAAVVDPLPRLRAAMGERPRRTDRRLREGLRRDGSEAAAPPGHERATTAAQRDAADAAERAARDASRQARKILDAADSMMKKEV
jgi:hypothetical protein